MMDDSSVRFVFTDTGTENSEPPAGDSGPAADALLREAAARLPDRLAYADPPNRAAFGLGAPRRLTFSAANTLADGIAARLAGSRLLPGERIAIQLPNIVELPLLMTGAWRAGLVPVCLPLMWRLDELHHALPQIDPAALFAVGRFGNHNHCGAVREAAAHHIAVRHIFGIGPELPDGVAPADDWFSEAAAASDTDIRAAASEDETAAMTWAASARGPFPVPRTHRELVSLGRLAAGALSLTDGDVTLLTYPLTSIAALGGQMIAALLAGAPLILHQPFSYDGFLAQLGEFGVTCAAIPDSVLSAMRERGDLDAGGLALTRIGRVRPWPHLPVRDDPKAAIPVFDIHTIGELALVIEQAPAPAGLPLGKLSYAGIDGRGEAYLETRVRGSVSGDGERRTLSGALLLRGASVPSGPFGAAGALAEDMLLPDAQGFVNSRLQCTVDEGSAGRFFCARDPALIYHGGVAIGAAELDSAYASFPGVLDAAAVPIEDELMGDRIFAAVVPHPGQTPSLKDLKLFLAGKGLADYKCPDQLVIVKAIPRDAGGAARRERILGQV